MAIVNKKMVFLGASLALILLAGALVCSLGVLRVEVQSKTPGGQHLRLMAPAIVLPLGALLVPRIKVRAASRDLQPWLPTIQAATEELIRCPDAALVQVDNPREHVSIVKAGGALVIDVDEAGETVHVSVPLRAAAYACTRLAKDVQAEPEATGRHPI